MYKQTTKFFFDPRISPFSISAHDYIYKSSVILESFTIKKKKVFLHPKNKLIMPVNIVQSKLSTRKLLHNFQYTGIHGNLLLEMYTTISLMCLIKSICCLEDQ